MEFYKLHEIYKSEGEKMAFATWLDFNQIEGFFRFAKDYYINDTRKIVNDELDKFSWYEYRCGNKVIIYKSSLAGNEIYKEFGTKRYFIWQVIRGTYIPIGYEKGQRMTKENAENGYQGNHEYKIISNKNNNKRSFKKEKYKIKFNMKRLTIKEQVEITQFMSDKLKKRELWINHLNMSKQKYDKMQDANYRWKLGIT